MNQIANLSLAASDQIRTHYESGYADYRNCFDSGKWVDYPRGVSIETFAYCNAACTFCPYPDLERKQSQLPAKTVEAILNDLAAVPGFSPERLVFSRVNEPLLDKRLFDFMKLARTLLPQTTLPMFSNGTTLTDKNIDQLIDIGNIGFLVVSLNDHRKQQHERLMSISYDKVVDNLDRLNARHDAGEVPFPVSLTRVASGDLIDEEFQAWCGTRWPHLHATIRPAFEWLGAEVDADLLPFVPTYGCSQWFDLNILADGREAFCCIDSVGMYDDISIHEMSALEIYNRPTRRKLREAFLSRQQVNYCQSCTIC